MPISKLCIGLRQTKTKILVIFCLISSRLYHKQAVVQRKQQNFIPQCAIFTTVWLTHHKKTVIGFLAWGMVTWKINYVSSMCGSQEGSVPFHIHSRQPQTHLHTLLTFKQVDVSHSGHSDSACCGGPWCWQETTSQVGVRRKTSINLDSPWDGSCLLQKWEHGLLMPVW